MFQVIWIVIVGAVLGYLAKFLLPGKQSIPAWLTVLCGMLGALVGNFLATMIGVNHTGGIDWIRHILQIGCAVAAVAAGSTAWPRIKSRG